MSAWHIREAREGDVVSLGRLSLQTAWPIPIRRSVLQDEILRLIIELVNDSDMTT